MIFFIRIACCKKVWPKPHSCADQRNLKFDFTKGMIQGTVGAEISDFPFIGELRPNRNVFFNLLWIRSS